MKKSRARRCLGSRVPEVRNVNLKSSFNRHKAAVAG